MKFPEILEQLLKESRPSNLGNNKIRRKCWVNSSYYEYDFDVGFKHNHSSVFLSGEELRAGDWEFYDERIELQVLKAGDEFRFDRNGKLCRIVAVLLSIGRQTTCDNDQIFYLDYCTNTVTYAHKNIKVYLG